MSKEKTPKINRKTTGLDIVSRILTCGLAVAIPAAAYFLSIIYYEFQSTAIALIARLTGDENDTGITYGYITIKSIVTDLLPTIRSSSDSSGTGTQVWEAIEPLHNAIYATGIIFALSLLIAVVLFFVSCFSNSNKLPLILGAIGLISTGSIAIAFRAITAPIVDGSFQLTGTLLSTLLGGLFGGGDILSIIGSLAGSVSDAILKFTVINLSTAWVTMLVCYIVIVIWHGAMLVVNLGDKPKQEDK
ncbi:MAG: hypothetical protein Q3968_00410 [Clostridiaceae bacterium]|nr:hypothetical protein [Clostridiaceae bacterium]